jgi:ATP-dependent DNA helicase RecQ
LAQEGWLALSESVLALDSVQLRVSGRQLQPLASQAPEDYELLVSLVRQLGGAVYQAPVDFSLQRLARKLERNEERLRVQLQQLHERGWLSYQATGGEAQLYFLRPRQTPLTPESLNWQRYRFLAEQAQQRAEAVLQYAADTETCRSRQLQAYFGERSAQACGVCDVCAGRHAENAPPDVYRQIREEILAHLRQEAGTSYSQLLQHLRTGTPRQREEVLRELLRQEELLLDQYYTLHLA